MLIIGYLILGTKMQGDAQQLRDKFLAFAFSSADLFLEIDETGRIGYAIGAAERIMGQDSSNLTGKSIQSLVHPPDWIILKSAVSRLQSGQRFDPLKMRLANCPNDSRKMITIGGCRLPPNENHLYLSLSEAKVSASLPDITAVWATTSQDDETGLLNEGGFLQASEAVIGEAKKLGQSLQLTLIEIDGLEDLRQRAGPERTNDMLESLGGYLRSQSVANVSGRLSPEKFSILHGELVEKSDLTEVVTEISKSIDPLNEGVGVNSSSIDIDPYLDEEDAGRALVYTINSFANSQTEGFTMETLNYAATRMMQDALTRISEFKASVRDKKIKLVYQPIVDLETLVPHHYEILARFAEHEDTFQMVTFAENVGIIQELDLAISESALELLTRFLPASDAEGSDPVKLAVNLSGRSMMSDIFIRMLMNLLKAHQGQEDRLLFEITESANIKDLEQTNNIIQEIRRLGYKICLDDFGAGAASFQYLQAFDVDFIKIDGNYVRDINNSERETLMLKSIAGLARSLNVGTVAEMVETEAELKTLKEIGITYGQGYLFGKPEPIANLVREFGVPQKATG